MEHEELGMRLREAGLRETRPRCAVYALMREAGGHHSVDDIAGRLAEAGEALPRQTIYNVVADLTAAGLLMCADAGPGRALYEAAEKWHHHFVCRRCATIIDVPCARGAKPCLDAPDGLGLQIDEVQVIYRGLCPDCRRERDCERTRTPAERRRATTARRQTR